MRLLGIDVSESNGLIDWHKVKDSELVHFVYAKATEGFTIQDSLFKTNHDKCKELGIPFGPYHFFHFGTSSPVNQAFNFKSVINGYEGQLLPMVDVESASQDHVTDWGRMCADLNVFLNLIEKDLKGKKAIIYTGYSFWNDVMRGTDMFDDHPVWVAAYEHPSNPVPVPDGFKSSLLWQYSETGVIPGFNGRVDTDLLLGNMDQIER